MNAGQIFNFPTFETQISDVPLIKKMVKTRILHFVRIYFGSGHSNFETYVKKEVFFSFSIGFVMTNNCHKRLKPYCYFESRCL